MIAHIIVEQQTTRSIFYMYSAFIMYYFNINVIIKKCIYVLELNLK